MPRKSSPLVQRLLDDLEVPEVYREPSKAIGRPPVQFDQSVANDFLERFEAGETVFTICRSPGMPSYDIINRWKRENPAFYQAYSRAREASAEACEHNALASAEMAVDNDTASAARVRVMAWQWTAAKRNPRVYADKIDATVTINVGLAERLSAAIGRASRVIDVDAEPSGDVGEIG